MLIVKKKKKKRISPLVEAATFLGKQYVNTLHLELHIDLNLGERQWLNTSHFSKSIRYKWYIYFIFTYITAILPVSLKVYLEELVYWLSWGEKKSKKKLY